MAFEGLKLNITYPTQLVCFLADIAAERQVAVTEAIRDCLEAARTLGGAALVTHERLAYLAHRKNLRLQVVVADVLERAAQTLAEAPTDIRTGIHEYSPDEVAAVLKRLSSSQVRGSGVRFSPQIPLQELAHLERLARLQKSHIAEAAKGQLEFWRTLGGISVTAHQRIRQFAREKEISLESAVANLLTEYSRQLDDPPASLKLSNGLQVLPLEGILERLGDELIEAKVKHLKAASKKNVKNRK
jgi:hypothetical protein